jgi:apolipoprotein N-acyltransferase
LRYTIVQPDIRQDVLNDSLFYYDNFRKTAGLSNPAEPVGRRIVIWPESGIREFLDEGYPPRFYARSNVLGDPRLTRAGLARVAGPGGLLITGTNDLVFEQGRLIGARNSVKAIDDQGAIAGSYAKAHLVPFGEYLPLRGLLEPLGATRLVPGSLDFLPGPGPRTLDLGPWGRVGVQVCYEIVFSGNVVDREDRPDFIYNGSNDGWFGGFGPPQHLAQARLRAIEEGLPVLRATTTGISAVIDARGVVRAHVPMHTAARLDGLVPPAHAPTLFARLGNFLPLIWASLLLLISIVAMRQSRG